MNKEREAFEGLQNQKIFKRFEFDSSVNAYVLKDISATLEKLTALAELNYGWDMWQAAKALPKNKKFNLNEFLEMEQKLDSEDGVITADLDRFIAYAESVLIQAKALKESK